MVKVLYCCGVVSLPDGDSFSSLSLGLPSPQVGVEVSPKFFFNCGIFVHNTSSRGW